MPILVFVYFTQFLDKNILSYASIMGFPVTGIWYNDVAQVRAPTSSLFSVLCSDTTAQAFYMGFLIWMFPTQYIGQNMSNR